MHLKIFITSQKQTNFTTLYCNFSNFLAFQMQIGKPVSIHIVSFCPSLRKKSDSILCLSTIYIHSTIQYSVYIYTHLHTQMSLFVYIMHINTHMHDTYIQVYVYLSLSVYYINTHKHIHMHIGVCICHLYVCVCVCAHI